MTDNEIIKALECCFNNDWNKTKCNECPFYNGGGGCIDELKKSTLDLINRLQAEKVEVIKEFAQKFEEEFFVCDVTYAITKRDFHDFVKEMVGEE